MEKTIARALLTCALAAALSALLLWFGTGLHPVWWLTWVATLPVLFTAPRLNGWQASATACIAWALGGLNEWTFLHRSIELPIAVVLLAVMVPALVFALAVLSWRQFVLAGRLGRAALSFAAVWVTFEFAMQALSANSTASNIAYSQMNCLPILQVASLAGPSGIDFLLFFIPGALAALLVGKATLRHRLILTGIVGALLTLTLTWGASRLANTSRKDPRVKVGLIASDLPQNLFPQSPEAQERLFSAYDAQRARLMDDGAELVVLPEKIARVESRPQFSSLHDSDAVVLAGIELVNGGHRYNEALLSWPNAAEPWHYIYRKHHLVPGFEDRETPGTERLVLPTATGKWGVEICKDMDFPALSRQYGNDEVGLMIVPAWDFVKDDWLHDRMAVMRGVEGGFTVVRAAKQGLLSVSDDRGRILAEKSSSAEPFSTLLASAPVHHTATLYTRFGDLFGWANVVWLTGVSVFWRKTARSRKERLSFAESEANELQALR